MSPTELKCLRADWRKLAKAIGRGRLPSPQETDRRYQIVMERAANGRDPYPPFKVTS